MKKLSLIFLICFFSYISFSQKTELSNYEKYRIEKEKQENLNLNSPDTIYIVDTVYLEQENQESTIINNYYTNDYSLRHRLYIPWYFDDLFMYGYSYPYYNWNYFAYNPWYFGYQPWSFRYYWSYWNTPYYYSSYYIYNPGCYYVDRDYYRNRYRNQRNGVIRHRNTSNPYIGDVSNYESTKTKIANREPVKVNRTVYLDKNTRRNISDINTNTKTKVVNNRRTTYKPTYTNVRTKRPAYNSTRTTRRITTSQNKSTYYKRPTQINKTRTSISRSSGTRSSISRSSENSRSSKAGSGGRRR